MIVILYGSEGSCTVSRVPPARTGRILRFAQNDICYCFGFDIPM